MLKWALLILVILPLILAECPPFLQGIKAEEEDFAEALDVACGRHNNTAVFWSRSFIMRMLGGAAMKYPEEYLNKTITSLFSLVDEHLRSSDNADIRAYAANIESALLDYDENRDPEENALLRMEKEPLPASTTIALVQLLKRAFGIMETPEIKQQRVDATMASIYSSRGTSFDELCANLYLLVKGNDTSPFEQFAERISDVWIGHDDELGPDEIVPVVDFLYQEYIALENAEAKSFIDWVLWSMAMNSEHFDKEKWARSEARRKVLINRKLSEPYNFDGCPSFKGWACFHSLSAEAQDSLRKAFPEVNKYLERDNYFSSWMFENFG